MTGLRLVGVGIGFVGVALLVGAQPEGKVLGALAVVGMALCYAIGGLLAGRHLSDVQPPVVALGTTAVAALVMLPFGIAQAPAHVPGWETIAAVVVLAVPLTAIAFLIFYAIILAPAPLTPARDYPVPPTRSCTARSSTSGSAPRRSAAWRHLGGVALDGHALPEEAPAGSAHERRAIRRARPTTRTSCSTHHGEETRPFSAEGHVDARRHRRRSSAQQEPESFGRSDRGRGRAGRSLGFRMVNERNRIVEAGRLVLAPRFPRPGHR